MSLGRRALQVVALICTLIVGTASMAVIVTQTTWFKEWLRGFIIRQAEDYVNGRLSIGRLDGNLFFGVELEDVDVTMNGKTVVDIKDVGIDYNAFTFITGNLVLDDIRINQPVLHVARTAEGWNIARMFKARTPDPDQPTTRRPLEIGEIGISDGTVFIEDQVGTSGFVIPSRIEKLDASVGVTSDENELRVDITHLSLRAPEEGFGVNALSGVIRRTEDAVMLENVSLRTEETSLRVDGSIGNVETGTRASVNLKASSDKFTVNEIAKLVPMLRGYELQPAFELTASGPLDRMSVDVNAREQNLGKVIGDLTVDIHGPEKRIAGTALVEHFNALPLVPRDGASVPSDLFKTDVTGTAQFDLALPSGRLPVSGTYTLRASYVRAGGYEARDLNVSGRIDGRMVRINGSAAAYGGRATAVGTINTVPPVVVNISGRAANIDLRRLPPVLRVPGAASVLQFTYNLTSRGTVMSGDATLGASTLAGASIAAGTTVQFAVGSGAPEYAAQGQVSDLDPQAIGRAFAVPTLAADRFRGRVSATFDVKGTGGGRYPLTLDATGTAVDAELFGATFPRMDFTTNFAGGDARVKAIGTFDGLNPAVVFSDERLEGNLSGAADVETTIRGYAGGVTIDNFDATGRVNLGMSTVGDLAIDSAVVDGTYADRAGELTQLSIAGPDVNVNGQGTIALNETGSSNLTAHVESPSLDRIGEILGYPLKGAVVADTTITGNATELKATGMLKGSNVGYGESEALTLTSDFTVSMPDLTPAKSTIESKSVATFVEVGGQRITGLTADTTYSESRLTFNAVAQEGKRELAAQGSAVFHPDHQEVHLGNLTLQAEMIQWRTAPNAAATIRYGGDKIAVENLRLVSGDQRIDADGVIGGSSDTLKLRVENVDVAQLDQLLLGEQRLAGRLTANGVVSGPTSAPRVEGTFTLTQGAFRQFMFESFGGTVDYVGRGMKVDVRLQQSPQAWIAATGYAPVSLFQPTPPGTEEHEAPTPGESVDLQVTSSQIDLGLVQGFTSYVTDVTGVLQANVKITGSGRDPHLDGAIEIRGGAFAVPQLGTAFTGLQTRIELTPDEVKVGEMRILDRNNNVMTVGGTLAVHERAVGAVDVKVQSRHFQVVRNTLASLSVDTDLRLTGNLRAPRLVGSLDVDDGSVDLGLLLDEFTADPYTTEPLSTAAPEPGAAPAVVSPFQGLYDALALELGVGVPSSLVLRGTNLRPVDAPIDIGDINVTVGGAVQLTKAPGGKVQLTGEVNTVRGTYQFQGRRFEILRDGRLRFDGTEELDPQLDLMARRVISGVETFIRVQGTMTQPELTFTSNPPQDQADILSLIIFGAAANELGEGQQASLVQQAGALAGGYLASGLARSIGQALRLDEFEIQAQGEGGLGPTLSIGEQLGGRTYFRIRQGFGSDSATEFILEYQIADYLRLQGSVAETSGGTQRVTFRRVERAGIDLIFFFSY